MTASPTAVAPSPSGKVDGSNALAALFASATQRQSTSPVTTSTTTKQRQQQQKKQQCESPISLPTASNSTYNGDHQAAVALLTLLKYKISPFSSPTKKTPETKVSKQRDQDHYENSSPNILVDLMNCAKTKQHSLDSQNNQQMASSPTKSSISVTTSEGSSNERKRGQVAQVQKLTKTPSSVAKVLTNTETTNASTPIRPTKTAPLLSGHKISASKLIDRVTSEIELDESIEFRSLETWHDEDEELIDESCYQELVDLGNTNGWSADEMFKYNEKRHKITSSYTDKTLGDKYTTPLSKNKSKTTVRMATKLAKEIEDKLQNDGGRVTPESSDDDEIFELERARRKQHVKQLEQLKTLKTVNSLSIHSNNGRSSSSNSHNPHVDLSSGSSDGGTSTSITNGHGRLARIKRAHVTVPMNNNQNKHHNHAINGRKISNKSSSQQSNSSTTPATVSLSSSPTLNDSISHNNHHHLHSHQQLQHNLTQNHNNHLHQVIKPPTSSSRNILRACLT